MSQKDLMEKIYRYQRYIYDITRKYFLLGRDRLIAQMEVRPGMRICEIGCGTARNLLAMARLHPEAELFGIDISDAMLTTARAKVERSGRTIRLAQTAAEDLSYRTTFGLDRPFDAVFFSYSLSMIPDWPGALKTALENLTPQGAVYVVDFWDQRDLPGWFRAVLTRWLALFHVHHKPELIRHFDKLAEGPWQLDLAPVHRRYAYIARLSPSGAALEPPSAPPERPPPAVDCPASH